MRIWEDRGRCLVPETWKAVYSRGRKTGRLMNHEERVKEKEKV